MKRKIRLVVAVVLAVTTISLGQSHAALGNFCTTSAPAVGSGQQWEFYCTYTSTGVLTRYAAATTNEWAIWTFRNGATVRLASSDHVGGFGTDSVLTPEAGDIVIVGMWSRDGDCQGLVVQWCPVMGSVSAFEMA
jgi:hypothetical protein